MELDFSCLGYGAYKATVVADGINADRAARDYTKEEITIDGGQKLKIEMKSGGGWAAVVEPVR